MRLAPSQSVDWRRPMRNFTNSQRHPLYDSDSLGGISLPVRSNTFPEIAGGIDRPGVVEFRGIVVLGDIAGTSLLETLPQSITARGAGSAVCDHLCNFARWAWVESHSDAYMVSKSTQEPWSGVSS